MIDAETSIKNRRERGRRSQAAFRQRQAQAAKDLVEENRMLKETIGKVLCAKKKGDFQTLLSSIDDLAEAARIEVDHPVPQDPDPELGAKIDVDLRTRHYAQGVLQVSSNTSWFPGQEAPLRVVCGISLDPLHYTRISLPPEDIIPYLGIKSTSFAGCLFWSIMEHSQNQCKSGHSQPAAMIKKAISHSTATNYITTAFMQAMVDSRVEYKRTGSMDPKYGAAADQDLSAVLLDHVEKDYRAAGRDTRQWISCLGIEKYVRKIASPSQFLQLEHAVHGEGNPLIRNFMEVVKCRLYDEGVCFGDGPRWHISLIIRMFSQFHPANKYIDFE